MVDFFFTFLPVVKDFFLFCSEASQQMHPPGQSIVVFRPDKATSNEHDETFTGDIKNYDEVMSVAATNSVAITGERWCFHQHLLELKHWFYSYS